MPKYDLTMLNSPTDIGRVNGFSIFLKNDTGDIIWKKATMVTNRGYVPFGADNGNPHDHGNQVMINTIEFTPALGGGSLIFDATGGDMRLIITPAAGARTASVANTTKNPYLFIVQGMITTLSRATTHGDRSSPARLRRALRATKRTTWRRSNQRRCGPTGCRSAGHGRTR